MRQDVADEQHLPVEMNRCDQPVLVAGNIENVEIALAGGHVVHRSEGSLELGQVPIGSTFDQFAPCSQRRVSIGVSLREIPKRLLRDHPHVENISQDEISVNSN